MHAFVRLIISKIFMTQNKNQIDLLKDPVGKTLKDMTIPMIYGMILLMTFNLVDTFFVGLLGTQPLAAISFYFSDHIYGY